MTEYSIKLLRYEQYQDKRIASNLGTQNIMAEWGSRSYFVMPTPEVLY